MMQLENVIFVTVILLIESTFSTTIAKTEQQDSLPAPCTFSDSVNITGYEKFANGSYLYDGNLIPANLVGIYYYEINELSERIPVEPHARGCICKLKPCVQFCCPLGQKFNGTDCRTSTRKFSNLMNITTKQGDTIAGDVFETFAIKYHMPCDDMYHLTPHISVEDAYTLFENGTLFRKFDQHYLSSDEYCITPYRGVERFTQLLVPANCYQTPTDSTKSVIYSSMMLFSVPFMILTIIVYIVLPELRTLHGKSLCCYLLGLCVGYSILGAFLLIPPDKISQFNCSFFGFTAYFSFMASFFWLSVISFDLFYNIRAPRGKFNERKRFILYSLYSWGMACIMLAVTFSAQQSSWIDFNYKPSIGSDEYCWLNVKTGWSALIYFYGPIIIIIGFNITMFVLTSMQIHSVQKEMSRMMQSNDSQRNLRTEKDRFGIFLRLFIVMGVTWSMEILSYCIGTTPPWDKIFIIPDILNGIQGFLIFTLFVLKRKIKQYLTKRFQSTSLKERQSQYSNKTTTSTLNIPMNVIGADRPLINRTIK